MLSFVQQQRLISVKHPMLESPLSKAGKKQRLSSTFHSLKRVVINLHNNNPHT